ncbi:MAG: L-histidine N(alpha)-methyltransferase [Chloroflexi bacterium]|nr:L-histidine N(alpha)-methyltransferase [Chloroflexota bacterium]
MKNTESTRVKLDQFRPGLEQFRAEVISGLQKQQKELPSKYFYDEKGSRLFERICTLDEYYIPRTERAIMKACIDEVVELIGPRVFLLEYGSGDCRKVRFLLDNLDEPVAYAPIDISMEQLAYVSQKLAVDYSGVEVLPVCADYTNGFELPTPKERCSRRAAFFPGSTISNFDPAPARKFLRHIAEMCRPDGALLIGVDLKKDPAILHKAYNDEQGITAEFNLNLLERINRELGADFSLDAFEHYAFYNPRESRVEMHLVSQCDQTVRVGETTIFFARGESIWTENSYKYNADEFAKMAADAGFRVERVWSDPRQWFSVQYLVTATAPIW